MRILMAEVYNPQTQRFAEIGLPASYEEMKDALQVINASNEECIADIQEFLGKFKLLNNKSIKPSNLYELNYFASLFSEMQEYEQIQFMGLLESFEKESPEIKEVINLALNMSKLDCYKVSATTDTDLGRFYIDNELIPQLDNLESLTDEQYDWICTHLDEEHIGREMREQEKGVFTRVGYLVKNQEIAQLYDERPVIPQPADYVFCLELSKIFEREEVKEQNTVSLKLPASESEIEIALETIGAENILDCCFEGYESVVIPQLTEIYGDSNDFNIINQIAKDITKLDDDSIVLYKSMLESVKCSDFQTAEAVYGEMEKFTLEKEHIEPSDYVDKVLKCIDIPLKEELDFYLSKDEYGRALMHHDGVEKTAYGMLIPKNGITLSNQIQKQQTGVEIKMFM